MRTRRFSPMIDELFSRIAPSGLVPAPSPPAADTATVTPPATPSMAAADPTDPGTTAPSLPGDPYTSAMPVDPDSQFD